MGMTAGTDSTGRVHLCDPQASTSAIGRTRSVCGRRVWVAADQHVRLGCNTCLGAALINSTPTGVWTAEAGRSRAGWCLAVAAWCAIAATPWLPWWTATVPAVIVAALAGLAAIERHRAARSAGFDADLACWAPLWRRSHVRIVRNPGGAA